MFFEVPLMEIVGETISCATHKKREETRLEKQLTQEIRILENRINANNVTLLEEKKTELQAIRNRQPEGMIVQNGYKMVKKQVYIFAT